MGRGAKRRSPTKTPDGSDRSSSGSPPPATLPKKPKTPTPIGSKNSAPSKPNLTPSPADIRRPANDPPTNHKLSSPSMSRSVSPANSLSSDASLRSSSPTNSVISTDKPRNKIPPIFLQSSAWRQVANKLMTTLPDSALQAKSHTGSTIKLTCVDVEVFRIVQKYLSISKVEFHTLPLPDERVLKVIIKGLPNDITENEISEELSGMGFEVKSVRQFQNSVRKFPIHLITLALNAENKKIFNLSSLFYISVQTESYRSNKPAQCFSCQRFGHSSTHCGYAPRCVKCAGPHLAKDCAKPREITPKCTNCDGPHTANYSQCPALLEEKESRRPKRPNTSIPPPKSNFPSITPSSPSVQNAQSTPSNPTSSATYASKLSPSSSPNPKINTAGIIAQLTDLITNISSGKTKVKDAVVAILTLLPLLLNING